MNLFRPRLVFFSFLFFTSACLAMGKVVAVVDHVAGKATQLRPGALSASLVNVGDKLMEDTSVVTSEKSFIRIRMNDQSTMSIGPGSMITVKENLRDANKKEVSVLSLMKGKMRAAVPTPGTHTKMMIETRSAAMGVRGTDFQVIYSPQNNHTGVITYEGKVAMAMMDDKGPAQSNTEITTVEVTQTGAAHPEVKPVVQKKKAITRDQQINNMLQDKDSVVVQAGQYSGTVARFNKPSLPVKISPVQLQAMGKNFDMTAKANAKDLSPANNLGSEIVVNQADQAAPPEGIIDEKKGLYAPRAGGFVDMESGLYVAPDSESDFDLKRGVYIPKNTGNVDNQTGQFIPPTGTKFDASKGFVPVDLKNATLVAMATNLNKSVAQDVVLAGPNSKESIKQDFRISMKDTFVKDRVAYRIQTLSQSLDNSNDAANGDRNISSKSGSAHNFEWFLASGTSYQPFLTFGLEKLDYTGNRLSTNPLQRSENLLNIGAGIRTFLRHLWTLDFRFETHQTLYLVNSGAASSLEKVSLILGHLDAQGLIWEKNKFGLYANVGGTFNPSKTKGDAEVGTGFGLDLGGEGRYWYSPTWYFNANLKWETRKSSVKNTSFNADVTHQSTMFGIGTGYFF